MSSTLTPEAPHQTAPHRPRRTSLIVLVTVLVLVGIGVGTWAIIQANQSDDLAVATEFADTADIAWTTRDGETFAALFTEDGIWKDDSGVYEGRDEISIRLRSSGWANEMQHGAVTEIDDGVFAYPWTGVWGTATYTGETHITLEGDLVSYAEVVRSEPVYE